jgi:hypothetical protein
MDIKEIKVTAEATWMKGKIDGKQPENGEKTVTITKADLVKIAKDKMEEDIHSGYQYAVTFTDFKFSVDPPK